jgi:class 3 adenylate cyclase
MSEAGTPETQIEDSLTGGSLSDHQFRILISITAATTLVSHISYSLSFPLCFFLFWCFYPLSGRMIIKEFRFQAALLTRLMPLADAFLLGTLVHVIGSNIVAAVLFLTLITCHSLVTGGSKKCGAVVLAYFFGLFSAYAYFDTHFIPLGDIYTTLPSLIGISVYLVYHSVSIQRKAINIRREMLALKNEQQDIKVKTWNLSRYVSPQVWKLIFSGYTIKLETKRKQMTVFFSDIKGFSELSEQLDPHELSEILSEYLTEMSNIVLQFGGTIDKYIGDAIMVFYGDPSTRGLKQDCIACVSMAIEMKRKMKDLQLKWQSQGISVPLEIRMGINSGYCTVGNFGTQQRMDYTVIGTEVNLASRLESVAPPGEILISQSSHDLIRDMIMCRNTGPVKLKGFAEPVQTFQVMDFKQNLGGQQTYFDQQMDGFSIYMDIEKIKNYDQDKVLKTLLTIATRLKNRVN